MRPNQLRRQVSLDLALGKEEERWESLCLLPRALSSSSLPSNLSFSQQAGLVAAWRAKRLRNDIGNLQWISWVSQQWTRRGEKEVYFKVRRKSRNPKLFMEFIQIL